MDLTFQRKHNNGPKEAKQINLKGPLVLTTDLSFSCSNIGTSTWSVFVIFVTDVLDLSVCTT